jgi:hypothetical protein
MRRLLSSKSESCTESLRVEATGINAKGGAHYPGRSVNLPCATGVARCREGLAEVSRRHSRPTRPSRRPEPGLPTGAQISMTTETRTSRAEKRDAPVEGGGRNRPVDAGGASRGTARRADSRRGTKNQMEAGSSLVSPLGSVLKFRCSA